MHAAVADLRVGEDLVQGVDRAAGHVEAGQAVDPFGLGLLRGDLGQQGVEGLAVAHAVGVGGEARVGGEFGRLGEGAEALELPVVADRQDEVAVGAGHDLVGHDVRVLVALALGDLARGQVVEPLVDQPGDLGVEQRQVDLLASAGLVAVMQGGQDRGHGVHAAHDVGDADPDLVGLALDRAGQAHDPAQALGQVVVAGARRVGTGLAEAGDRAVDQARAVVLEVGVGEAVLGQAADLEVLHQDVAAGDQAARQGLAFGLRDIKGQGAFVAVRAEVVGGLRGVLARLVLEEGRAPFAGVVAFARPLDLDDVAAQVAEQLGAGRAREDTGQVEDAEAGERCGHGAGIPGWLAAPGVPWAPRGVKPKLAGFDDPAVCPRARRCPAAGTAPSGSSPPCRPHSLTFIFQLMSIGIAYPGVWPRLRVAVRAVTVVLCIGISPSNNRLARRRKI